LRIVKDGEWEGFEGGSGGFETEKEGLGSYNEEERWNLGGSLEVDAVLL
jgi:hypothetical protein